MIATTFKEQTAVLIADGCQDLPVFSDGNCVVSKWVLSQDEIELINRGESIYLFIYSGNSQPPINFNVGSPFIEQTHESKPML